MRDMCLWGWGTVVNDEFAPRPRKCRKQPAILQDRCADLGRLGGEPLNGEDNRDPEMGLLSEKEEQRTSVPPFCSTVGTFLLHCDK